MVSVDPAGDRTVDFRKKLGPSSGVLGLSRRMALLTRNVRTTVRVWPRYALTWGHFRRDDAGRSRRALYRRASARPLSPNVLPASWFGVPGYFGQRGRRGRGCRVWCRSARDRSSTVLGAMNRVLAVWVLVCPAAMDGPCSSAGVEPGPARRGPAAGTAHALCELDSVVEIGLCSVVEQRLERRVPDCFPQSP